MLIHACVLISVLRLSVCVNLTYYVEENKSPRTFIGDIADVIDSKERVILHNRTSVVFAQMLLGEADTAKLFHVSKHTGKLYTAETLDAESLCTYNVECFRTLDIAIYQFDTLLEILEIKVIIQDVNDHRPEFPVTQANVEFFEGNSIGARKPIPNAVDGDVGYFNARLEYSLRKIHDEPFSLLISKGLGDTQLLRLTLQGELDREIKDAYLVQVVAKDGGTPPKENVLNVQINVVDVNDNSPIFTQKIYNVSVDNKPNNTTPIAVLSANDPDLGKNGEIVYSLLSKTSNSARMYFRIDKISGEIFLKKKVPGKETPIYKLYIEARDKGSPSLSSVTKVVVSLVSQKNDPPVIQVKFVFPSIGNRVNISEDTKIGSFVAYVKISDLDVGRNGEVNCNVRHDLFRLENLGTKKYKIVLNSPLDRETKASHNLTITCQDSGLPPLKSKSEFFIQVMDVNDVQPRFSQSQFEFWIHENQKSNFPVGFINVTDLDLGSGHELTYSLVACDEEFLPFQISNNGFISTASALDHESKEIYRFQVLVKDNGIPSLNNTANVVVEVKDENDNAPYFTFPSVNHCNLDVVYYPRDSKNITQIKASDSDSQENAFLKYEIIRGNSKQIFTINQYTGLLSSTHVLSQQDAGSYELEFLVKDSGSPVLSARTTVYLTLIASNKTISMSNTEETRDEMELHVAISIWISTVTISVVFTVFLLVFLIRRHEYKDNPSKERIDYTDKFLSVQGQRKYHSYSACPQGPPSVTQVTDHLRRGGADSVESKKRVKMPAKICEESESVTRQQKSVDRFSQVYGTEGQLTTVGEIEDRKSVVGLGSHPLDSENNSPTELRHDWSEQMRRHETVLQELYSCPQKDIFLGETNRRTIKNQRSTSFIDEKTMIFSRCQTIPGEMLPSVRFLYTRPECSRPLTMASIYQLSQTLDNKNYYMSYEQRTLPITRL